MAKNAEQYKFQLTIDSDSILISQAPDKGKSRVTLTNLEQQGLKQIAKSIIDANLSKELIELLADDIYTEPVKRDMFILYLGLEQTSDKTIKNKVQEIVNVHCDSFTMFDAEGYFKNEKEHTLLIQIGVRNQEIAYKCAEDLREHFGQEGVGVMKNNDYKRVVDKR